MNERIAMDVARRLRLVINLDSNRDLDDPFRLPSRLKKDVLGASSELDHGIAVMWSFGGYDDDSIETTPEMNDARRQFERSLDCAITALTRVRFYYCSATPDADQTPELAVAEFEPACEVA